MAEKKKVFKRIYVSIKKFIESEIESVKVFNASVKIAVGNVVTKWSLEIFSTRRVISLIQLVSGSPETESLDGTYRMGWLDNTGSHHFLGKQFKIISNDKIFGLTFNLQLFNDEAEFVTLFCDLTLSIKDEAFNDDHDDDHQLSLSKQLESDLKKMFEDKLFTDFKLVANDGIELAAHKAILATRSPVFFAMLNNDMEEKNENAANIADFDSETISELLRFIYCNEIEGLEDVAHDLIYAAEKYELDKLKEICVDSIIKNLTVDNVLKSLVVSDRVSKTKNMFDECLELIARNIDVVSKVKEWKELPNDCLLHVFEEMSRFRIKQNEVRLIAKQLE